MQELLREYEKRKEEIEERLVEFEEHDHWEELCFCLLTPQSKARSCDQAVKKIGEGLRTMSEEELARALKGYCRFHNNKAKYVVGVRGKELVLERDWLVRNVKGLGMKEATHFLRNIGESGDLAILDRHILKNLKKYGIISEVPKTLTKKKYLRIEGKMQEFSERVGIPMTHLDLLFWSMETGEVFK